MYIKRRIKRLEKLLASLAVDCDLYDHLGNKVEGANILREPSKESEGLAELPDGARKKIALLLSMKDVILATAEIDYPNEERRGTEPPEPTDYSEYVFARPDGIMTYSEIMCGIEKRNKVKKMHLSLRARSS